MDALILGLAVISLPTTETRMYGKSTSHFSTLEFKKPSTKDFQLSHTLVMRKSIHTVVEKNCPNLHEYAS